MKDILGFEGLYAVTKDGRVWSFPKPKWKSHRGLFLSGHRKSNKGYALICLTKDGKHRYFSVHRLVAKAYIPNPKNLPQVNHKNGIKTDNQVENLEWCTNQENRKHAIISGTQFHKLTSVQVLEIRKEYTSGLISHRELALKYGVEKSTIGNLLRRRTWTHI